MGVPIAYCMLFESISSAATRAGEWTLVQLVFFVPIGIFSSVELRELSSLGTLIFKTL
eukprot:c31791_g1_i1 orf=281-454(+)